MRSLRHLWARAVGDDVAGYFPFAYHRLVLGVLLAGGLVTQTMLSIDGARPDVLLDQQLLSNESDANSVVTVQRESFNLALALSDWGHGAASARDVQVARALLGKRMSVVTQSRTVTARNVGDPYLAALADLDEVILGLADTPPGAVMATLMDAEPVVQAFLTEARALNEIFQLLGRQQVELVLETNR